MKGIKSNISDIKSRINTAEKRYERKSGSVKLLAVSKTKSVSDIEAAIAAGQLAFGENYVQEAVNKIQAIQDPRVEWHFIGDIQSNKTKQIAKHFAWVHSVTRIKIAQRLHEQRPDNLPPLNVCIEVNVDGEVSKAGLLPQDVLPLVDAMQSLNRLKLRGLMAIPKPRENYQQQLQAFQIVAQLQQALITQGIPLDTLSMGMSADFEAAIEAGSTIVRVGTAIFGSRS